MFSLNWIPSCILLYLYNYNKYVKSISAIPETCTETGLTCDEQHGFCNGTVCACNNGFRLSTDEDCTGKDVSLFI